MTPTASQLMDGLEAKLVSGATVGAVGERTDFMRM